MNQRIPEITVEDLKARLERGEAVTILDVREPSEVQICRIEGSTVDSARATRGRVRRASPRGTAPSNAAASPPTNAPPGAPL